MSSRLNCSTIAAAVCLCNFIWPVRSGDFGFVLLALRNAPSERFCLTLIDVHFYFSPRVVFCVYLSVDIVQQTRISRLYDLLSCMRRFAAYFRSLAYLQLSKQFHCAFLS